MKTIMVSIKIKAAKRTWPKWFQTTKLALVLMEVRDLSKLTLINLGCEGCQWMIITLELSTKLYRKSSLNARFMKFLSIGGTILFRNQLPSFSHCILRITHSFLEDFLIFALLNLLEKISIIILLPLILIESNLNEKSLEDGCKQ